LRCLPSSSRHPVALKQGNFATAYKLGSKTPGKLPLGKLSRLAALNFALKALFLCAFLNL